MRFRREDARPGDGDHARPRLRSRLGVSSTLLMEADDLLPLDRQLLAPFISLVEEQEVAPVLPASVPSLSAVGRRRQWG